MSCEKRNILKSLLSMTAAGFVLCCSGYDTNDLVTVRLQDTGATLLNPGMGLVHYHYSNRLWAYGMYSKPGDTDPLPGTSVVYMRVLWSDLEPKEGEFRWDIFATMCSARRPSTIPGIPTLRKWETTQAMNALTVTRCPQRRVASECWRRRSARGA